MTISGNMISAAIPVIIPLFIGVILGTISGLIPGIHSNTAAGLILSAGTGIFAVYGETGLAVCMVAVLIVHTFLDIVPGTFFGVPDADTALSVLPAHRLCLLGHGEEAVRLSAIGSAYGTVFGLAILSVFLLVLPAVQDMIDWWSGIILIIVAGVLIVWSESPEWSFAVFCLSGILGVFAFEYSWLCVPLTDLISPSSASVLMPLLTGLFGISVLIFSKKGSMPPQTFDGLHVERRNILKCGLIGTFAGSVVGWLPGLSNASANAVIASFVMFEEPHSDESGSTVSALPENNGGPDGSRGYIIAASAANTANAFISIGAFYAIMRMRNGVMAAFSHLKELPEMTFVILAAVIAAIFGYLLTIGLSKAGRLFSNINVRSLGISVIIFMTAVTLLFTGIFGLFILILATVVGSLTQIIDIRRVPCIGAVMIPVILFSFGIL
ncbi:tripartite tricarboxylate transporter permease [Methanomicrobium mobile]|uniref:tripartite tricarboxylate transporter permease n=1 Tax=Methanomicrobium mobile TaxID=2205 RepID=UPI000B2A1982|nr:tripartite tricarboxylate transporter permease [Methanomicrobium mobile]